MPNGVMLTMDGGDVRLVSATIAALGGVHGSCSVLMLISRVYVHRDPIDFWAGINSLGSTALRQSWSSRWASVRSDRRLCVL